MHTSHIFPKKIKMWEYFMYLMILQYSKNYMVHVSKVGIVVQLCIHNQYYIIAQHYSTFLLVLCEYNSNVFLLPVP